MKKDSALLVCILTSLVSSSATFLLLWSLNVRLEPAVPAQVLVPVVANFTPEQARQKLQQAGLKLTVVETRESPTVPKGKISRQLPAAGTRLPPGMAVQVMVSDGRGTIAMPTVEGLPLNTVMQILANSGLKPGPTERAYSDTVDKGMVVTSVPGAGVKVEVGSQVKLVVSRGPDVVEVPRIAGLRYQVAFKRVAEHGFKVGTVSYVFDEDHSNGVVLRQSPAPGKKVDKGTPISLVINRHQ